jgi:prepilin-type N-terminal cleavage/methylation domain-containing protein
MTLITQPTSKRGFTFLELVIVIALIMIIMGVSFSVMPNVITERAVYNAALQIQQDILLVQNKAITNSTTWNSGKFEIYFYPSDNIYYVYYVETDANASFNPTTKTYNTGKVYVRKMPSGVILDKIVLATNDSNQTQVSAPPANYIRLTFDNFGTPNYFCAPDDDNYWGIFIRNSSGSKIVRVNISKLGSISVEWVKR